MEFYNFYFRKICLLVTSDDGRFMGGQVEPDGQSDVLAYRVTYDL